MKKNPACQTLLKALDISSATLQALSDLLEALAILSDTSARKSKVGLEDLKPYWKSEKKTFLKVIKMSIINKSLKAFTNQRKKTTIAVLFCSRPLPNILK